MISYRAAVSAMFITVALAGCAKTQTPNKPTEDTQNTEPITIGFVGALTGDAASYGEPVRNAIELSANRLNASGGINGRPLHVIFEDGKCNGKDAVSATQKLMSIDTVSIILGGVCSGETLAMATITEPQQVLVFSPISSSPDITHAGDFVFRNSPSDADLASQLARYAHDHGFKKAAIISAHTDYAQAFKNVFVTQFERDGGMTVSEDFNPDTRSFQTILAKLKTAQPDLFVINTQSENDAATIMKEIKELGIAAQLYGNSVAGFSKSLEAAGEAASGMIVMDAPGLSEKNQKATDFLEAYKNTYGTLDLQFYAGGAYDSVNILADAIRAVGMDTEKIRDYLYNLNEYDGVIGQYHFDENGDIAGIKYVVSVVKNGTLVRID